MSFFKGMYSPVAMLHQNEGEAILLSAQAATCKGNNAQIQLKIYSLNI